METLNDNNHKARKEHKCNYCGGKIDIGTIYNRQTIVNDGLMYDWKSHISCGNLASKLEMFDWCDDGVTEDDFITEIQEEYRRIMSNKYKDIYESDDFMYPQFLNQLSFVKKEHGINQ